LLEWIEKYLKSGCFINSGFIYSLKLIQMKVFRVLSLIVLVVAFSLSVEAQHSNNSNKHASHNHDLDPHKYHIGIGIGGAHIFSENVQAPAFHLHFLRQLGHHNQWGLGIGYEAIADEHWHNGLNLLVNYRPVRFLSLLAGPGLVIGKHDGKTEVLPAFHTEAVFEFNVAGLHIGPMIGYGRDKEDSHISVGVHVGFGF
jgi:hypothetical protein